MARELDPAAPDLASIVRPGDRVVWGQASAEPTTLTAALMAARHAIGAFSAFIGASFSATPDPVFADRVSFTSYCATGTNRRLAASNRLAIERSPYSQLPDLLAGQVDVLMLQLAPARDGAYSFGLAHDYVAPLIDRARIVIGEVNDQTPWTHGERTLTDADLDFVLRTSVPPPSLTHAEPDAVARAIAGHLAGIIADGAVLQVGLGAIPEAVLAALVHHRDLGIHSGAFVDAMVGLIEGGAVTNARKASDTGTSIVMATFGSERSFRFLDRNQRVGFRSCTYTHDAAVLAGIDRFTAINSALEVDLWGAFNSESVRGRYVGAVGGAPDFLGGAARSKGGLPIIALPATATVGGETVSCIVARLDGYENPASPHVGIVATEFGLADLRGQPPETRWKRLVAIADPRFREELDRAAHPRP